MTLPTIPKDVWAPATEQHKAAALASLASLPSRATNSESLDSAAYYIALEGVTRYGLSEAVRAIFKNALGHAFFPSPPELRGQCDKAMEHHVRMRDRVWLRERIARETPPDVPPRTEEEKARVAEIMREFHASSEREKAAAIEAERAEIRQRYGMTDEVLASIKDQPLPAGMVRVGQSIKAAQQ